MKKPNKKLHKTLNREAQRLIIEDKVLEEVAEFIDRLEKRRDLIIYYNIERIDFE